MGYIKLNDSQFHLNIPPDSGIYFIYSISENGHPKAVQRVLKIDSSGILYIGKSKNIKDRLRMLFRVLHPELYKADAHTFGKNYNQSLGLQDSFPLESLAINYHLTQDYSNLETSELKKYFDEFGEVPPLNFSR